MTVVQLPLQQSQTPKPKPIAGRVPPNSAPAERATLSAMLSDSTCVAVVRTIVNVEDYFIEANQFIARAIYDLDSAGQTIDYVTVNAWLRDRELTGSGSVTLQMLYELVEACPAVSNVEQYALRVREKARLRRIQAELHRALAESYGDVGADLQAWMDQQVDAIGTIARERAPERSITAGQAAGLAVQNITAALDRGDAITGFTTGMPKLDKVTAGLNPGDLWLVTGRAKVRGQWKSTGAGKSAFCVNTLAANVALAGGGVVVFAMEDPREKMGQRLIAGVSNVDAGRMRRINELTMQDMSAIHGAVSVLETWPMYIDDRKDMGAVAIRARAYEVRDELRRNGVELKLIVVDNLQLIDWKQGLARWQQGSNRAGMDHATQTQGLSEFGRLMLRLAEELKCAVVVACQLNKEGHIAFCTAVENHAQVWIEIKREEVAEDGATAPESAYLEMRKQRDGSDGAVVPVWWYGRYVKFSEVGGYE